MSTRCDKYDISPIIPKHGITTSTLADVKRICVSGELSTKRRIILFNKFNDWIKTLKSIGISGQVIVDGSFLTTRPMPADIDCVLCLAFDTIKILPSQQAKAYNCLNRDACKAKFGVDVIVVKKSQQTPKLYQEVLDFFGTCRDNITPKGLLEVSL